VNTTDGCKAGLRRSFGNLGQGFIIQVGMVEKVGGIDVGRSSKDERKGNIKIPPYQPIDLENSSKVYW